MWTAPTLSSSHSGLWCTGCMKRCSSSTSSFLSRGSALTGDGFLFPCCSGSVVLLGA